MGVRIVNNIVYGPEEQGIPAHLSYGQFLYDVFRNGGNRVALVCAETGRTTTYHDILQQSVNLAVQLQKMGLKKGDVVGLSSENRFEFTTTTIAILLCGASISTLNITYSPGEISHILDITKPKILFTSPFTAQNIYDCCSKTNYVEKLIVFGEFDIVPGLMYDNIVKEHYNIDDFTVVDVNGVEDIVAIMCSSGTTGLPKGVMLTHVNFLTLCTHMRYYLATSVALRKHSVETALSLIPWFHAYGFLSTFAIMSLYIKVVFMVRFEDKLFLESIQNHKVNMTTLVPPLAVFLAKHPLVAKYDLTSLNEVWCGAAPLSKEIQLEVTKRTGINLIRQGYGLTEVTMACCVDLIGGDKAGSCGVPAPGMRIKVIDIEDGKTKLGPMKEGELWIKSPLRMKGYMGNKAESDALFDYEGYVRSGDIGYYDKQGTFYIVDRLKELIKYNGFQVAPAELEALLLQHGGIQDCGVVGLPDERAGELPIAFVVKQPNSNPTEKEIIDFIASKVSPAKHLRGGVIFVNEIPKNASGKILRRELRKLLQTVKSKL